MNKHPEPRFRMTVSFETDPIKADKPVAIGHCEVKNLIEKGPSESDLQKAKEYFLKQRPEDKKENNRWSSALVDYYLYDMDKLTGYEDNVKTLTTKSVQEFAQKTLQQGNCIDVIGQAPTTR